MTDSRRLERVLDAYLADGVDELADRVLDAALLQIDHTHQRRHLLATWRFPALTTQTRVAAAAVIGVLAVGGLLYFLRPAQTVGPATTASSPPAIPTLPPASPGATASAWTAIQPPSMDRGDGAITIELRDGGVLYAGGGSPITNSAEVFDPATGWKATGAMSAARNYAVAVRLSDGRVLVAGGSNQDGALDSVELYDPSSGTWTSVRSMTQARSQAFGAALYDGRVLLAGGGNDGPKASAELYDPKADTWTPTGNMTVGRAGPIAATVIADGEVFVVGGFTDDARSSELFDPELGTWTATARAAGAKGDEQSAVTLPNGRIMVFGGQPGTAEIYDPGADQWAPTTGLSSGHLGYLASAFLADGNIFLVAGGTASVPASLDIYNTTTNKWHPAGTTLAASFIRSAIRLQDGSVLVIAGSSADIGQPLAELYVPS